MAKICFFTGARSEYWLLRPLMKAVLEHESMEFCLLVSGSHLSPEHGYTVAEIEKDGFPINERVDILLSADTTLATCKSMGIGMLGISDALDRIRPDILVVLGDRFETFTAVSCACILQIPVAHLHGGEVTEGAYDDSFRHAITKMSHLHFVSTEEYRQRVIQLGEPPDTVFYVGAIGVESIRNLKLLTRAELEKDLGFSFGKKSAIITFHPVTRNVDGAVALARDLLSVLAAFESLHLLFTGANADACGLEINSIFQNFAESCPGRAKFVSSLGQIRYFSALQCVDFVIGNSSSGIIEAPSFGVPVINIGDRQKGRVYADNIIQSEAERQCLQKSCELALSTKMKDRAIQVKNPYDKLGTVEMIVEKLMDITGIDKKKHFFDLK
jgi:GDP/UDP-N,N'-diacetylbacillosamine 2-epimerase (hydrolysing)